MHVRKADVDDIDTLVRIRVEFVTELNHITPDQGATLAVATRDYLAGALASDMFGAWLAEDDGRVVGMGVIVLYPAMPMEHNLSGVQGYVMNIFTAPARRGEGIGAAIVDAILAFARDSGVKRVWLRATEAGVGVYEKAGFVRKDDFMQIAL